MSTLWDLNGLVAVIVGAGGGIGRELAITLRRDFGCHLALCDINEERLRETVACVSFVDPHRSLLNLRTTTHLVDVSKHDAVLAFAEDVRAAHGRCELVINVSGIASSGTFETILAEEMDHVLTVNFGGAFNVSKAFLPLLRSSKKAGLINAVSAVGGLCGIPGASAFSISSFATRGLTESLMAESAEFYPNVHIGCAFVGCIRNSFLLHSQEHMMDPGLGLFKNVHDNEKRSKLNTKELSKVLHLLSSTPSKEAAQQLLDGIRVRQSRIFVGNDAQAFDFLTRLLPALGFRPWLLRLMIVSTLLVTRTIGRRIMMGLAFFLLYRFSDQIQTQLDAMLKFKI